MLAWYHACWPVTVTQVALCGTVPNYLFMKYNVRSIVAHFVTSMHGSRPPSSSLKLTVDFFFLG